MAEIGIQVPQQLIEDIVRAAVVRELAGQEQLIEGIVKTALSQKKDSYSKQTLFISEVDKMIRAVALEAVQEWIDQNRDRIRTALVSYLQSGDGLAAQKMVDGIIEGISRYSVSVQFNWKD